MALRMESIAQHNKLCGVGRVKKRLEMERRDVTRAEDERAHTKWRRRMAQIRGEMEAFMHKSSDVHTKRVQNLNSNYSYLIEEIQACRDAFGRTIQTLGPLKRQGLSMVTWVATVGEHVMSRGKR